MAEAVLTPLSTFTDQVIVNGRQMSETRTLGSLWAEGPVALVFLRRLEEAPAARVGAGLRDLSRACGEVREKPADKERGNGSGDER
jgi:hypothetical protein